MKLAKNFIVLMVLIYNAETALGDYEATCEDCENQLRLVIKNAIDDFKQKEPFKMYPDLGPCSYCEISQIHNMTLNGSACAINLEDGGTRQYMILTMDHWHADCDCTFKVGKQHLAGKMMTDWMNPKINFSMSIKDQKTFDVEAITLCNDEDKDMVGLCKIPKKNLKISCESSNAQAKEACTDVAHTAGAEILEIFASHGLPGFLEDMINHSKAMIKRFQCAIMDDDDDD